MEEPHIRSIPTLPMRQILQYLDIHDLYSMEQVSKEWHQVATSYRSELKQEKLLTKTEKAAKVHEHLLRSDTKCEDNGTPNAGKCIQIVNTSHGDAPDLVMMHDCKTLYLYDDAENAVIHISQLSFFYFSKVFYVGKRLYFMIYPTDEKLATVMGLMFVKIQRNFLPDDRIRGFRDDPVMSQGFVNVWEVEQIGDKLVVVTYDGNECQKEDIGTRQVLQRSMRKFGAACHTRLHFSLFAPANDGLARSNGRLRRLYRSDSFLELQESRDLQKYFTGFVQDCLADARDPAPYACRLRIRVIDCESGLIEQDHTVKLRHLKIDQFLLAEYSISVGDGYLVITSNQNREGFIWVDYVNKREVGRMEEQDLVTSPEHESSSSCCSIFNTVSAGAELFVICSTIITTRDDQNSSTKFVVGSAKNGEILREINTDKLLKKELCWHHSTVTTKNGIAITADIRRIAKSPKLILTVFDATSDEEMPKEMRFNLPKMRGRVKDVFLVSRFWERMFFIGINVLEHGLSHVWHRWVLVLSSPSFKIVMHKKIQSGLM